MPLKANFDPRIVSAALQAGLGVDCVSGNEVRTAIESGCPASKIVFAGVAKKRSGNSLCFGAKYFRI